jgi:hypothetical protein
VVHFSKNVEYLGQWGTKGSGDGQFNLVHDGCPRFPWRVYVCAMAGEFRKVPGKLDTPHFIAIDSTGAVYSADFRNWRVDKFVRK